MEVDFDIPTYGDNQITCVIMLTDLVITTLHATEHIVPMAVWHNAELHINVGNAFSTSSFDEEQYQQQFAEDQAANPKLAHIV